MFNTAPIIPTIGPPTSFCRAAIPDAPVPVRAAKQQRLAGDLVQRICRGELRPGDALPTLSDLQSQYGLALKTVQRSLEQLKASGILTSRRGSGTFVAAAPPMLRRFALVFEKHRDMPGGWSQFYEAMWQAAPTVGARHGVSIERYAGVTNGPYAIDTARLADDMQGYRIGGLIMGVPAFALRGTAAMEERVVPAVGVQSGLSAGDGLDAAVYPDFSSFARRSLAWLKARGCQRPAVVAQSDVYLDHFDVLLDEMREAGFEHEPWWFQAVPQTAPRMATNAVLAMINPTQARRPDALIIIDDQISAAAMRAVAATDLRPGHELQLVTFRNFPSAEPLLPDRTLLGFDAHDVLDTCVTQLLHLQTGGTIAPFTQITARFASEVPHPTTGAAPCPTALPLLDVSDHTPSR